MPATQFVSERRQAPRVPPTSECECRLPLRLRVRLLDLSLGGALLHGDTRLPAGTMTRLRLPLGSLPFTADTQVRRVTEATADRGAALAVSFVNMDEHSRRDLEAFIRRARS